MNTKKKMTFSDALELIKQGEKLARTAWDKDSYLYLGDAGSAHRMQPSSARVLIVHDREEDYFYAYASDFDMSNDLLADDWMLYEGDI